MDILSTPGRTDVYNRQPLAMAFITAQPQITSTFDALEALRKGTLFPELYKPFMCSGGRHYE